MLWLSTLSFRGANFLIDRRHLLYHISYAASSDEFSLFTFSLHSNQPTRESFSFRGLFDLQAFGGEVVVLFIDKQRFVEQTAEQVVANY